MNHLSHDIEFHIGEKKLKRVTFKKGLDVTIDDQLSWEEQIDNISKQVSQGIGVPRRAKWKLNWKNLSERRQQKTIAYVSEAIAGNCPENISKKFEKSYSERYDLRNNNFLSVQKPRTNYMVRTFGYAAANIWNENNKFE